MGNNTMSESDNTFSYKDGVSLKEHFDSRLKAIEKASDLAAEVLKARLESMNEFREAMKDQTSQFVTRNECTMRKQATDSDIRVLREYKAALEGKASFTYVTITLTIAILSLFLGIVGLLLRYGG